MDKIEKALKYATDAHFLQKRKVTGIPYVVHCVEVMKRVSDYGIVDEDILAACLLHDVMEDCESHYGESILPEFGWNVSALVKECTRPERDDATKLEKYKFLQSFAKKSTASIVIKIADRFCNVQDYLRTEGKEDYASTYALQAYPLYQAYIHRTMYGDKVPEFLSRKSLMKVMGDVVELNMVIDAKYKDFSSFVDNKSEWVKEQVT
jgi:(p)ppGpp synthase/HD superfamily hydrolase